MINGTWEVNYKGNYELYVYEYGIKNRIMTVMNPSEGNYCLESVEMGMYEGNEDDYFANGRMELDSTTPKMAMREAEDIMEKWLKDRISYYENCLNKRFGKTD